MEFYDVLNQALTLLEREKRVSYRALKRQFSIDDEYIEDLKAEIIYAKQLAVDEDGKVLVWTGNGSLESRVQSPESEPVNLPDPRRETLNPGPISYTPPHLVQRILAEQTVLEGR